MKIAIRRIILITLGLLVLHAWGCRSRLGGDCEKNKDCGLGLYCDQETKTCDDRGKLLKKQAAETYVYPIPPKAPAVPVPVPVVPGGTPAKAPATP